MVFDSLRDLAQGRPKAPPSQATRARDAIKTLGRVLPRSRPTLSAFWLRLSAGQVGRSGLHGPHVSATLPGAFPRMRRHPPRPSRSVAYLRFGRVLVGFLACGENLRGKVWAQEAPPSQATRARAAIKTLGRVLPRSRPTLSAFWLRLSAG